MPVQAITSGGGGGSTYEGDANSAGYKAPTGMLFTINKVSGLNDVKDTRPIGLLSVFRNLLFGIQMNKIICTQGSQPIRGNI